MNSEQQRYIKNLQKKREIFEKQARMMYGEGSTRHSHAEISDWIKCFHCMLARKQQLEARHKLGLSNPRDYMRWRKRNTIDYEVKLERARENVYKFNKPIL